VTFCDYIHCNDIENVVQMLSPRGTHGSEVPW
jgi:hypothetical protein